MVNNAEAAGSVLAVGAWVEGAGFAVVTVAAGSTVGVIASGVESAAHAALTSADKAKNVATRLESCTATALHGAGVGGFLWRHAPHAAQGGSADRQPQAAAR
jgi:hypothetical protein